MCVCVCVCVFRQFMGFAMSRNSFLFTPIVLIYVAKKEDAGPGSKLTKKGYNFKGLNEKLDHFICEHF